MQPAPSVSLVNAVAFTYLLKTPGVQVFQLNMAETLPQPEVNDPDLSTIPSEYHEFADVFSKKEADKLPEHRPYDHTIPLQNGATPPFGGVYNLSETELSVLRKYLDDNLRKGYIKNSQSPCGAPVLFVKKSDGSL